VSRRAWKELYYHVVDTETMKAMARLRQVYIELGAELGNLPDCRSKSLAKTHLEDSLMRSMQALALQGSAVEPGE